MICFVITCNTFSNGITTKLFLNNFAGNVICFVQTLLGEEHMKASFGLNKGVSGYFVEKFLYH